MHHACGFAACGFALTIAAASATLLSNRQLGGDRGRRADDFQFAAAPPRRRERAARRPGRPRTRAARSGRTSQRNRVFDSANSSTASGRSPSRGTSFSVEPRAQAAGEGHFGGGRGQAAFAQVVAGADQPAVDRRVQGREARGRPAADRPPASRPPVSDSTRAKCEPPISSRVRPTW